MYKLYSDKYSRIARWYGNTKNAERHCLCELVYCQVCVCFGTRWCRPNRDSSGVRVTTAKVTDCAKGAYYHSPPGGIKEGGCKREVPLEDGHKETVLLNRGSVGESPLRSCSSPELSIDMEGLEEILTKARKVREMQSKVSLARCTYCYSIQDHNPLSSPW